MNIFILLSVITQELSRYIRHKGFILFYFIFFALTYDIHLALSHYVFPLDYQDRTIDV